MKFTLVLLLATGLAIALAEPEPEPKQQHPRGVIHQVKAGVAGPNPYIFLTVPHGRSQVIQGFEVVDGDTEDNEDKISPDSEDIAEEDDEEMMADDDDDVEENMQHDEDDDEEEDDMVLDVMKNIDSKTQVRKTQQVSLPLKNGKNTQMMVSRENAGAIMVPDEIIEIEGQSVIDEKTGKPAILLPRSILDSIPDGSVVALMERPIEGRSAGEERANRVIVRRRRRGSRRNVKRGRRGNRRRVNRRRSGNRRRRNGNRVRVVRVSGNRRRGVRGGNRRRRVIRA
ncbi:protein SDA1 homolog [Musca domestica]|uniref:Protein SDA1 homolog n=1 Tax=Musca domestica TaxID=7370 RepID=A0A1I8N5P3_MUSDO|nr:protein SDA1 homolog [Musca domestica]